MLVLSTEPYYDSPIFEQTIQIKRNTDGQCNDADGKRDCQFDAHEDKHGQATADTNHVVHEVI